MKVDIDLRSSDSLTPHELDEIWAVTDRYVETSRPDFEAKLRALPEVALWRTDNGLLIGLVSLDIYRVRCDGGRSFSSRRASSSMPSFAAATPCRAPA